MEKKETRSEPKKRTNALYGLGRLSLEEANEIYAKYNNENMRRLSDEEYEKLYETMYGQVGKDKPEDS